MSARFDSSNISILNSSSFTTNQTLRIEPISKEDISAILSTNLEYGEIGIDSSTKDLFATIEQGDNPTPDSSKEPKTFSLQPLAEAYKIAGGTTPQQREISSQARVIEAGLRDSKQRVEVQSPLTEKPEQAIPQSLSEGIDRTEEVLSRALESSSLYQQREGNLTISSNNGIRMSSLQGLSVTGANLFLGTATAILNNQVTSIASETIMNLTDLMISRVNGSSFTHVEDTNQTSSRNIINRATETSQSISTRSFTHGVELNSNTGSTMISTAGSGGHTIHSTGSIASYTDSSVLTLSRDQITMGAGSPPTPPIPPLSLQETPEEVQRAIEQVLNPSSSFIRIMANEEAGISSVTSGDTSTVSRGSNFTASSNSYSSSANTAAQVSGRQIISGVMGVAGDPRSHVFHQGSMIITGRMIGGFPSIPIDLLEFPSPPALPPKPKGYNIADLEKCLPSKYQREESPDEIFGVSRSLGIDIDQIREQAGAQSRGATTAQIEPGQSATEQDINTPSPNSDTNSNPTLSTTSNRTEGTSIANMLVATGAGGGPTNIYLDRYSDSGESTTSNSSIPSSPSIEMDMRESGKLEALIGSLSTNREVWSILEPLYTNNQWREYLIGIVGENSSINEEIRSQLSEYIETQLSDSALTSIRSQIVETLIEEYEAVCAKYGAGSTQPINPQSLNLAGYTQYAQTIADSLGINLSIPGIGEVSSIITNGIGISTSINSLIQASSTGPLDFGSIASSLSKLGIPEVASVVSLADYIRSNPNNSQLLDLARSSSIEIALNNLVPKEYHSYLSSISPLIKNLSSGSSINREDLGRLLGTVTGEVDLLSSIEPLISSIEAGREIDLDNPQVAQSLDSLLGGGRASSILSAYQEAKSIAGNIEALSAIPDLLSLMRDREVPLISQMGVLVSCLDLFNRIKAIIQSFKNIGNDVSSLFGSSKRENPEEPKEVKEARNRVRNRLRPRPLILEASNEVIENSDEDLMTQISLLERDFSNILTINNQVIEVENKEISYARDYIEILDIARSQILLSSDPSIESSLTTIPNRVILYPSEIAQIWKGSNLLWTNPRAEIREGLVISIREIESPRFQAQSIEGLSIREDRSATEVESARFFEQIPYLTQFLRLIEKTPIRDILGILELGPYQDVVDDLIILKQDFPLPSIDSTCFRVPSMDSYESQISITSFLPGTINFESKAPIGFNTPIQVVSSRYKRLIDGETLSVFQDTRSFSSSVINYLVTSYSPSSGKGVARLSYNSALVLERSSGVLSQYHLSDIGTRIEPLIERSYVVR